MVMFFVRSSDLYLRWGPEQHGVDRSLGDLVGRTSAVIHGRMNRVVTGAATDIEQSCIRNISEWNGGFDQAELVQWVFGKWDTAFEVFCGNAIIKIDPMAPWLATSQLSFSASGARVVCRVRTSLSIVSLLLGYLRDGTRGQRQLQYAMDIRFFLQQKNAIGAGIRCWYLITRRKHLRNQSRKSSLAKRNSFGDKSELPWNARPGTQS